jgi:2-methylcitrate dehydratase
LVRDRLAEITRVEITTHESAIRIIHKTGPLANPADRDHCLEYMTAIGLICGTLTADHYEDAVAVDPRIDVLRAKMTAREEAAYSRDYLDPEKRSIANAVQVFFADGTRTPRVEVEYPVGHRRRRAEGIPLLVAKCEQNLATQFEGKRTREILDLCADRTRLRATPVREFMELVSHSPAPA